MPLKSFLFLLLASLPALAQEGQRWRESWTFPDPFSMQRPVSPPRSGGGEVRFMTGSSGSLLGFPVDTEMATERGDFIVRGVVPLLLTVPAGGQAGFGLGDPRLTLKGSWKTEFPIGQDRYQPAAWSLGADINLPLTALFAEAVHTEDNPRAAWSHTLAGFGLFPESPLGWVPGYLGLGPRAALAVGTPRLFFEAETAFPSMFPIRFGHLYDTEIFFTWAVVCGTQPEREVSVMAELSGVVSLFQQAAFNRTYQPNMLFATVSSRVTLGTFIAGAMVRISALDVYRGADSPWFIAGIFVGAESLR